MLNRQANGAVDSAQRETEGALDEANDVADESERRADQHHTLGASQF